MIDYKAIEKNGLYDYIANDYNLTKEDLRNIIKEYDYKNYQDLNESDYKKFTRDFIKELKEREEG